MRDERRSPTPTRTRHPRERAAGLKQGVVIAAAALVVLGVLFAAANSRAGANGRFVGVDSPEEVQPLTVTLNRSDNHEKYINGYEDGMFLPNDPLSRAQLAQMLYAVIEERPKQLAPFSDVSGTDWYYQAAGTLGTLGIMTGNEGAFLPEQPVTRAECVVILSRVLRSEIDPDAPAQTFFYDVPETHPAHAEISWAVEYGLFSGVGPRNFNPDGALTRAEAVTVLNRLMGRAADEAVLDRRGDLRVFLDVPTDFWAYCDIMEATVSHVGAHDEDGRETWESPVAERTVLADGYHTAGGYVYRVADGVILRGLAGETCPDPNNHYLAYDENGRAQAIIPDGYYVINGSVYRVYNGMFLYGTSDGHLTYGADGRVVSAGGPALHNPQTANSLEVTSTAAGSPVPLIRQNPQLPNGCEVTSLAMALAGAGCPVDKMVLYENYLPKADFYYQGDTRYGPDPREFYVGDAASRSGGWYCFEGPVIQAANDWLADCGSDIRAASVSGLTQDELDVYANLGIPVIAWVTLEYAAPRLSSITTWRLEDGTLYHPYSNLHCVLLTGMSGGKYQIADPIDGLYTISRDVFWKSFSAMGSWAVVV